MIKKNGFIAQFKDFVAFLQNLWGLLAGISIFFPLSNTLTQKGIPMKMWDEGGFAYLQPESLTTITTIVAIFIIFWTYGQRHKFKSQSKVNLIRRQAGISFSLGLLALVFYLFVYILMREDFHFNVMGWHSDDPRRLSFDLVLLLFYIAFFALMTRSFTLLGMIEYFRRSKVK